MKVAFDTVEGHPGLVLILYYTCSVVKKEFALSGAKKYGGEVEVLPNSRR